jgi:hypothetical protein
LWIEKYRYDFQKDCPELADKTVAWLESIMRDPQSGGSSDPEALTGTAKVAQTLCSKITSQNPVAIMGLSLLPVRWHNSFVAKRPELCFTRIE